MTGSMNVWEALARAGQCSPRNPKCRLRAALDGEQWCDTNKRYVMRSWEARQFVRQHASEPALAGK